MLCVLHGVYPELTGIPENSCIAKGNIYNEVVAGMNGKRKGKGCAVLLVTRQR